MLLMLYSYLIPYLVMEMDFLNNTSTIYNDTNESLMYSDLMKLDDFCNKLLLALKILYLFLTIPIIMGNTLVLLTTWRERRLHQPNKYFIACLAVADLLVGIFIGPVNFYQLSLDIETEINMSIHWYRFMVWIDTFALTASVYTLTFISFDRYLKISKPLQYISRMTTSKSLKVIFTIWLISVSFATYAATPDSGSWGILVRCILCYSSDTKKVQVFYTFLSANVFFIPAIVMIVMYVLIFVVAHKRHKMLRNGQLGEARQRNVLRRDLKVVRMLLVIVGVFVFCWFPKMIFNLLLIHKSNILFGNESLSHAISITMFGVVSDLLPLLNSLCNPLIYACMDQIYREAFKRLFQQMCRTNAMRQPSSRTIRRILFTEN